MHLPDFGKQGEVGHVAGADPQHVGVAGDHLDLAGVEHFGHERQAEHLAGLGQQLEALLGQPLEGEGAGAGLESVPPQNGGAGLLDGFGGAEQLVAALDRAGAGDGSERPAADAGAAHFDDGVLALELAGHELVVLQHRHGPLHPGHGLPGLLLDQPPVAHRPDHSPQLAVGDVGFGADAGQPLHHAADLFFGGARLHDDDHHGFPFQDPGCS